MSQSSAELGRQRDRALLTAAGTAVVSRLVTAAAAVLTLALVAHSLPKAELGVVAVLTTLTLFLGFGDLGLGTLLMTRLPAAQAHGNADESRQIVTITISTLAAMSVVLLGVGAASSYLMPWPSLLGAQRLAEGPVRAAVLCFFVCGAVSIPASIGGRVLASMQRSSVVNLWNAGAGVFGLVATVGCVQTHAPLWAYVAAIAGAPAVLSLIQTAWVLTTVFPSLRPATLFVSRRDAASFLRAGSMFATLNLTAVICYYIDSLVVSSVLGAAAAAVFALAARLFALVGGTLTLAGQQMWSALSDAVARGDLAWARARFRHVLVISTSLNAAACFVLVLVGRRVSRIWVGASLVPPTSLLVVLAIWTVYSTAVVQASYLLAAVEKVRTLALAGAVMAPVNLVLSIEFTRHYGLTGPILGSIVALLAIQTAPVVVLCHRQLREFHPAPDQS